MKHDFIAVNDVGKKMFSVEMLASPSYRSTLTPLYSVYVSSSAVELREIEDERHGNIRLVCSQSDYQNIVDFAINLAKDRHLLFKNFVPVEKTL